MTRLLSDLHGRFSSPRRLSFIALAIGGALGLTLASTSPASAQVVVHDHAGPVRGPRRRTVVGMSSGSKRMPTDLPMDM